MESTKHCGRNLDDSTDLAIMIAYGLSIIYELLLSFPVRFASPATELWVNREKKTHLFILKPEGAQNNLSQNVAICAKNGTTARGNFTGLV